MLPYSYLSLEEYYRVTGLICMFALLELVFEVINSSIFQQNMFSFLCVGADEVGNWAGSGEILAAAHLFQVRIGVFQDGTDEQLTGWSWYPSIKHFPDSPVILHMWGSFCAGRASVPCHNNIVSFIANIFFLARLHF